MEDNTHFSLKEAEPGRQVYGIEQNPPSAAAAREVLDQVFEGDVQAMDPPLEEASLDCLIFADVLEHLVDPLTRDEAKKLAALAEESPYLGVMTLAAG